MTWELKFKRLDKRGVFQDWLPLVVSIVILTIVFFFMFFGRALSEAKIDAAAMQTASQFEIDAIFSNYLISPVTVWDKQGNIADLVIWSINNDDYARLEEETKKIFIDDNIKWSVSIYDSAKYSKFLEMAGRMGDTGRLNSFSNYRVIFGEDIKNIFISKAILPVMGNEQIGSAYVELKYILQN